METGCLMGLLSLLAMEDFRSKKIPMVPVIICGILGVIFHILFHTRTIWDLLGGFAIGFVLYFISIFTKGKIGKGDGFLFMVTGVYLGFWNNLFLLWLSCVMAGLIGMGIIVLKHKGKNYQMPFVPFVLLSSFSLLLMRGGSFV
ncbi:MAG: prepilin peptidase [Lachnospiraceae bacterium]|nr:prepilin peptidase [Lachnospiraceae bacterium]